jgi:hypothetical protein
MYLHFFLMSYVADILFYIPYDAFVAGNRDFTCSYYSLLRSVVLLYCCFSCSCKLWFYFRVFIRLYFVVWGNGNLLILCTICRTLFAN